MKKNIGRVFAGILLIALAVFIVMGALGIGFKMPADIQIWQWIVGGLLLLVLIDRVKNIGFVGIFVTLGFEVLVFEPQLGKLLGFDKADWISNWLVFFVSVLVGIGFSMIFKGFSFMTFKIKKNTLGSTIKYIDCTDFKKEIVNNKLGELEVRFENVGALTKDATLEIHNSLGETVVYVPEDWKVKINMINVMGDIEVDDVFKSDKKKSGKIFTIDIDSGKVNETTLTIKANNKLGEIQIKAQPMA